MNWHAVTIGLFLCIAIGAFCSGIAAVAAVVVESNGVALRWLTAMTAFMVVDAFLAGLVWA